MRSRGQILRFAGVGVFVAALYIILYTLLLRIGFAQFAANATAFLLAVAVQYVAQAGFTFGKNLADRAQVARFVAMIVCGLITSALITGLIGPAFGWSDWLSAACVTVVLPVQNYLIMARWVFAQDQEMDPSS